MAKFYLFKSFSALIILVCCFSANAQVILLNNGSFGGTNFAGPANTSTSSNAGSRFAYIFPQSVVSSLQHNDTIRSISFIRNGGAASIGGTCNMKIFIRTTVNSNYGTKSINWVNLSNATGMKKVYDKSPASDIGSNDGWVRFIFSTPYVVDTVLGKNLEILVEYTQASAQFSNIFWSYENSGSISAYANNQTKFTRTNGGTLTDTTNFSTELHPSIRIEFPRSNFDFSVNKVYSLGKLPVPLGNPDTVRAIVQNVGKVPGTFKLYLQSKGANHLMDSATYTLDYLEEKLVNLPLLYPSNTGLDTLTCIIQKDSNLSNNRSSVLRLATTNIYSYKDPTRPIVGGIGFGDTTGDFVAKFYSSSPKAINQISVSFAGSSQDFKLGIWKADGPGGVPGTNIWTSDTLRTAPSFITPVLPAVEVEGNFFVGVRQIGNTNVAFGYQPEQPVRPNTFFYTVPYGGTSWSDFSPDAPFKFAIEPRMQAVHDVAPFKTLKPKDTVMLLNIVKMAPKASIVNFGSANQLTPFKVKMNIYRYGNLEYSSIKQDTLSSGLTRVITFDSSFLPVQAGDYDVHVITMLGADQMTDNDTLRSKFIVAVFKDVGPGTIFDPSNGYDYEQFVDTIYPTVFIQNYGLDKQGPFNVRAEIYDSAMNLIYSDSKAHTLTALNSVLASFKPFPCDVKGKYFFRAFTELNIDVDKLNDTVRRTFYIIRSNDVAITSIKYPSNGTSLSPPVAAKKPEAVLENLGDLNQSDPFPIYCDIYFNSTLIYRDSISLNSFRTIPQTLLFKAFQATQKGYYRMQVYSGLPADQYRINDTAYSVFAVGVPDDVEVVSVSPAIPSSLQLNTLYKTTATVRNNGYNPQINPFNLIFRVSKGPSLKYIKIRQLTLDSGETKTIEIDSTLSIADTGAYSVKVYTTLYNDFIPGNDTFEGIYSGSKSYDIGVSRILYPSIGDTLLSNIQNVQTLLEVVNKGDSSVNGYFRTTLRILNKANGIQLYNKSIDTLFNGKDSLLLQFPAFGLSTAIDIRLIAYTSLISDQFNKNDTAFGESKFRVLYDAVAEAILKPEANRTYLSTASDELPQIRISNNAVRPLDSVFCRLIIKRVDTVSLAETEVYRDSIYSSVLSASEIKNLDLNKLLSFGILGEGKYKAVLQTFYKYDQFIGNNQTNILFRIDDKSAIKYTETENFTLYPVPVKQMLTIEFETESDIPELINVYDNSGRKILIIKPELMKTELDFSGFSDGFYIVQCGSRLIKIIVAK